MTRRYGAIQCQVNDKIGTIRAITGHGKSIYLAFDEGLIQHYSILKNNEGIITLTKPDSIKVRKESYEIHELEEIGNTLLVFLKKENNEGGILISLQQDNKIETINDNVSCFAVDKTGSSPKIALYTDKRIIIKQYEEEKFDNIYNATFKEDILSIAIRYPNIIFITNNTITKHDIKTGQKSYVPMSKPSHPYCMIKGPNELFYYTNNNAICCNKELNSDLNTVTFDREAISHSMTKDYFISLADTISIYDFYNHNGIAYVPNATMVYGLDNDILVAAGSELYFLVDFNDSFERIKSNSIKHGLSLLPSRSVGYFRAIFEVMWREDKKIALSLLQHQDSVEILPSVFEIFDIFKFAIPLEMNFHFELEHDSSIDLIKCLCDNLFKLRSILSLGNPSRTPINTAIAQCLSYTNDCERLRQLLLERIPIQEDSMMLFYESYHLLAYPTFLASINQIQKAMSVLKEFEKTTETLNEAANILIEYADNWVIIEDNIVWLMESSPIHACIVLSSPRIDIHEALNFTLKKFPKYYYKVLYELIANKSVTSEDKINELSKYYVKLLVSITSTGVLENTECLDCQMKQNGSANKEDIIKELESKLEVIFKEYNHKIDTDSVLKDVEELTDVNLKIQLFSSLNHLERALTLLIESTNKDFNKCEEFCLQSQSPLDSLHLLILQMQKSLELPEFYSQLSSLIKRHPDLIDFEKMLSILDENTPIESLTELLMSSLNSLTDVRRSKEIEASLAEATYFESSYQLALLESEKVPITYESTCKVCGKPLGFQFISIAPNGDFYHQKCMPNNDSD